MVGGNTSTSAARGGDKRSKSVTKDRKENKNSEPEISETTYKCEKCSNSMFDDSKAMQCDFCCKWFCVPTCVRATVRGHV